MLTAEESRRASNLMAPPADLDIEGLEECSIEALHKAYAQSPLEAQTRYGGRWIKVRGTVKDGPAKIELLPRSAVYAITLEHKGKNLLCIFFGETQEKTLLQVTTGQAVTIVGKYSAGLKHQILNLCTLHFGPPAAPSQNLIPNTTNAH